ncbi:MAG: glycogen/starch/alpha-glucan phosphorylase [Clostridiales bacterium]|jgi:starch phosphorylase|nr:glycogen/starch/alpha-glucan phosphorylase [Clostridiales bacterium]
MTEKTGEVGRLIKEKLNKYFAANHKNSTPEQMYKAVALVLRDILLTKKQRNNQRVIETKSKRVYYLCMEFLLGRSLKNNLYNLGLEKEVKDVLSGWGYDLDSLYEIESDAGLGNGGLGRLAACFMDSLATLNYPAMGFSIRYDYGLFKQKIVDNQQVELPDIWLDTGEIWMMPRSDKNFKVRLGGEVTETWLDGKLAIEHKHATVVDATPYDVMISGADSEGVSVLRLWKASASFDFDMKSFTQGDYMTAMRADNEAEIISKVLYPSDDHDQGKQLRLSQQYFLVSASLQSIIKDHLKNYPSLVNLADVAAIHINDTHPALAIPELMRLLMDEYAFEWDAAWDITVRAVAYTNHTVMAEALEKWSEPMVSSLLPRVWTIIKEIDRRFKAEALFATGDPAKVERMSVVQHGLVRMANLSVIGSHSVNGVSELHSDIIKNSVFADFYGLYPRRFTNVTNGIAHRRWLCQSNPRLTEFLNGVIGEGFASDASKLENLLKFKNDKSVLEELDKIKRQNKRDYADYVKATAGFTLNPDSRFDTQIKRLHEYKRQLLNVLKIIKYYLDLNDDPNAEFTPQTFIFGAKAAGGYYHAKRIISLINCISADIQRNKKLKDKLDVMFVENYNVTKAEHLIPASEISEQISLAGKEASGTSNMKFMINGALTLGTVDGANVEILESVGADNIFTFGMSAAEVEKLWREGYYATNIFASNPTVRRVVDALKTGFAGQSFADIANYLVLGSHNFADPYMCLADFDDYMRANGRLDEAYADPVKWNGMSLVNIAKSGIFAADRSIRDYAENIWHMKSLKSGAKNGK